MNYLLSKIEKRISAHREDCLEFVVTLLAKTIILVVMSQRQNRFSQYWHWTLGTEGNKWSIAIGCKLTETSAVGTVRDKTESYLLGKKGTLASAFLLLYTFRVVRWRNGGNCRSANVRENRSFSGSWMARLTIGLCRTDFKFVLKSWRFI